LKVLVSVGGWGADGFSDAAVSDSAREKFSRSAVEIVKRYGLEGFDVDWEFPGQRGPGIKFRPEDKENFTLMLASLRRHLDALSEERSRGGPDRYLLTIASNDNQRFFDHTQMDKLHVYLDFVNVMTYDMFSSGSPTTGHHTGLHRSAGPDAPTRTSEDSIERHLAAGIPARKIVLGVAFYGRGWSGVNPENNGLHQPYEKFAGSWGYDRIQDQFNEGKGFRKYWDDTAKAPYLWNPDSTMFISYDDPQSLKEKAQYVRRVGIGGIMYWEQSHDPDQVLLDALHTNLR
jgi:chitinase